MEVAKLLLATEQVDVECKDNSGWKPLSIAVRNSHTEDFQLLDSHKSGCSPLS